MAPALLESRSQEEVSVETECPSQVCLVSACFPRQIVCEGLFFFFCFYLFWEGWGFFGHTYSMQKFLVQGVPIVAQWKQIRLVSMRNRVQSLASLGGGGPMLP